jgi:hypothetical protein
MPTRSIAAALCLFFCICAEPACSRSSPWPTGLRETLKAWNTEAEEKTVDEILPWYQAGADDEKRLARSLATQAISTARLLKAVRAKWGHDAETVITHLCLTDTPEDDDAATASVHGDHVTVSFAVPGIAPLFVVHTNGAWRVDTATYVRELGPQLQASIKYCDRSSEVVDKLTAAILGGEISSAQNAIDALKKALASLDAEQ